MLNCWEYMLCGNGPEQSDECFLNCPVPLKMSLDGIHGGKNGGRACWAVLHTTCNGKVQDTFQKKYNMCGRCDFYNIVKKQQGDSLLPTIFMLK